MPPKRGASNGPAAAKARGSSRGAAPKAKPKAAPAPAERPKSELEKEAEVMFERYEPEGKLDGVLKLAQFADIVRAMNTKKCMIWGDDPAEVIKEEWSKSGGKVPRELTLDQFKVWWVVFAESVETEIAEKAAAEEAKLAAAQKAREDKYSGDGVWQIVLKDLTEGVQEAKKKGKTPLILDNTENFLVETYYSYNGAYIIECKKLLMDKVQKKMSVEDILEEERERFVTRGKCFKHGRTVVFRLANSATDLTKTFNSDRFPSLALMNSAEVDKVLGLENAANMKDSPFLKMAGSVDEELELSSMGAHENFNVVVVSQFDEASYEGYLKESIPLHLMQPMRVSEE